MVPITDLAIPLNTAVTLGFYLVIAGYTIFTFIMYYHWNEYSLEKSITRLTLGFYLLTTLPLVAGLGMLTFFII